jgi:hypothetical protein
MGRTTPDTRHPLHEKIFVEAYVQVRDGAIDFAQAFVIHIFIGVTGVVS